MNARLVKRLQIFFWLAGWAILVLGVANAGLPFIREYIFNSNTSFAHIYKNDFSVVISFQQIFSAIGEGFFAFLTSAVFGMIFRKEPASRQTERFLNLTCLGFLGSGVLSLYSWFTIIGPMMGQEAPNAFYLASYAFGLIPPLTNFVYAIAVYVLFRHFSQMVTFETEVV